MKYKKTILATSVLILASAFVSSHGHPSTPNNEHKHDNQTVYWENDPIKDGSSGHNHLLPTGHGTAVLNEVPSDSSHCWDDATSRYSSGFHGNETGHCYISGDVPLIGRAPTYGFAEPGEWTSQMISRIDDAVREWSDVFAIHRSVGVDMWPASLGETPDITIQWDESISYGSYNPETKIMKFPFGPDFEFWNFSKSKSGVANDEWHFYSIALHEFGHAFGFEHTVNPDSVMNPFVDKLGKPKGVGGVHVDEISTTDFVATTALYGQPWPKPAPPDTAVVWFNDCIQGLHSFTATWDSSNLRPGDFFEVEYSSNSGWIPWFEGGASCHAIRMWFPELLVRVRVKDIWGQVSVWIVIFAQGNCQGGDPF